MTLCYAVSFAQQDAIDDFPQETPLLSFGDDFDDNYGLVVSDEAVVIRSYADDSDDQTLSELQPRYIIMFEPNLDFVRRVEVRASSPPVIWRQIVTMLCCRCTRGATRASACVYIS